MIKKVGDKRSIIIKLDNEKNRLFGDNDCIYKECNHCYQYYGKFISEFHCGTDVKNFIIDDENYTICVETDQKN